MKTLPAGIVWSFPVKRNRTIGMRFILKVSIWIRQCISMDRYWVSGNMAVSYTHLLTCDPVAGLVEVPCVKRNVSGAVNAVVSSQMAIAGIKLSLIHICIKNWENIQMKYMKYTDISVKNNKKYKTVMCIFCLLYTSRCV